MSSTEKKGKGRREPVPDDVAVPIPPDGGYGWVVLVASFFVSFICDGCMYSFGIILDEIQKDFGATQFIVNLISSLNTGFLFMSGPAIAGFANQFGIRPVIIVGAFVGGCMFMASAFSPNIYFVMATFGFVGGVAMGCAYLPSVLIIAMYFDKKRGIATGITMAGSGVGAFAFAPFTQKLLEYFDWRFSMIILGAIVLQVCVLGSLMRPVPPTKKSKVLELKSMEQNIKKMTTSAQSLKQEGIEEEDFSRPMYKKDALYTRSVQGLAEFNKNETVEEFTRSQISIPTAAENENSCYHRYHLCKVITDIVKEMSNFKLLGQNKQFALIVIANFFVFVGYFLPFIYIPKRAKQLEIQNFALILSTIGIVNIPARIIFGIVADRKIISAFNLNTMCFALCAIVNFFYFTLINFYLQISYAVLFAIGIAGMNCLTSVYLVDLIGLDKLTNATGIISLFRGFGCIIGPFAGGYISDTLKSLVSAFFFSSACFAVGTLIVLLITIIRLCQFIRSKLSKKPKDNKSGKLDDPEVKKEFIPK